MARLNWRDVDGKTQKKRSQLLLANRIWHSYLQKCFTDENELVRQLQDNYEIQKFNYEVNDLAKLHTLEYLLRYRLKKIDSTFLFDEERYSFDLFFEGPNASMIRSKKMELGKKIFTSIHSSDGKAINKMLPEDKPLFSKLVEDFVMVLREELKNSVNCEIVKVGEIVNDFPELFNKKHLGVSLSKGYYIRVSNEEMFEAASLVNKDINLILDKPNMFQSVARAFRAYNDEGDYYFVNLWDAEQALLVFRKSIERNGIKTY